MIPNLQLMEGRQNESKNASAFLAWLSGKTATEQEYFKVSNYIPAGEPLDFANFKSFFEKRRSALKEELRKVLAISHAPLLSSNEFLEQETELEDV
jgi:hypothetical protein